MRMYCMWRVLINTIRKYNNGGKPSSFPPPPLKLTHCGKIAINQINMKNMTGKGSKRRTWCYENYW